MTIAAGFLCQDGMLFCADTEHQTWAMKTHSPKIGYFDCPGGRIGYSFAGNSDFALAAIQKCERVLKSVPPNETVVELEKCLDRQYRKAVLSRPDYSDQNLAYRFMIGISNPLAPMRLYSTYETSITNVQDNFRCLGIGEYLAHYLIGSTFSPMITEQRLVSLAAFALGVVKNNVPGCGGESQFLMLRNDGNTEFLDPSVIRMIEQYSFGFEEYSRALLLAITDPSVCNEDFNHALDTFNRQVVKVQKEYRSNIIP
jgi:hypothetical protein